MRRMNHGRPGSGSCGAVTVAAVVSVKPMMRRRCTTIAAGEFTRGLVVAISALVSGTDSSVRHLDPPRADISIMDIRQRHLDAITRKSKRRQERRKEPDQWSQPKSKQNTTRGDQNAAILYEVLDARVARSLP